MNLCLQGLNLLSLLSGFESVFNLGFASLTGKLLSFGLSFYLGLACLVGLLLSLKLSFDLSLAGFLLLFPPQPLREYAYERVASIGWSNLKSLAFKVRNKLLKGLSYNKDKVVCCEALTA